MAKGEVIYIRLDKKTRQAVQALAKRYGLQVSETIRQVLSGGLLTSNDVRKEIEKIEKSLVDEK